MPEYVSCKSIEHNLCFQDNALRYCTLVNNSNGGGMPIITSNYQGEIIDWEEFFRVRNEHRKIFQNGGTLKECEGCHQLEKQNWEQKDELDYILLSGWRECNSYCRYCFMDDDSNILLDVKSEPSRPSTEMPEPCDYTAVIKDMIEKKILRKDAKIDFAGGEPTIYPKFAELLNLFLDYGYTNIVVHTNSIVYSPEIERGIKMGVVSLLVSIDAGTEAVHQIVKRVNSYDLVWDNLERYFSARKKNSNIKLRTKYIIMPGINDEESELELWLEKTKSIGATGIILNVDHNLYKKGDLNSEVFERIVSLTEFVVKRAKRLDLSYFFYSGVTSAYHYCNKHVPFADNSNDE